MLKKLNQKMNMHNLNNKYWIFAGDSTYEKNGGMEDFQISFETLKECEAWWKGYSKNSYGNCWWHIFDSTDFNATLIYPDQSYQ